MIEPLTFAELVDKLIYILGGFTLAMIFIGLSLAVVKFVVERIHKAKEGKQ